MKSWQQQLVPQHSLSRFLGFLANARLGQLTQWAIKKFVKHYQVNLSEAMIENVAEYKTFNDFFTRALKLNARNIDQNPSAMVSPVDGTISSVGIIEHNTLIQAKYKYYTLQSLCADASIARHFKEGSYLTAYLSPKDYHRFHMPLSGQLLSMIHIPGSLFSVNQASVDQVDNLFARNERVICLFQTDAGVMAVIAVGAMIVGSIEMNWHGIVLSDPQKKIRRWSYERQFIQLEQGEEMGSFRLGSTIIVLVQKDQWVWNKALEANDPLRVGQRVAMRQHSVAE